MYEQVDKPKENQSKAVANSVSQKKNCMKKNFSFVENRAATLQLHRLEKIVQLAPKQHAVQGGVGSSLYNVIYEDQVQNFKAGAAAGDDGFFPVGSAALMGQYLNGTTWQTIAKERIEQGVVENYYCGHILGNSLGGQGGVDNIFAQDTSNNVGKWVEAEGAIRKERDSLVTSSPTTSFRVQTVLAARDSGKLKHVTIKGVKLDTVNNNETKVAAKAFAGMGM